MSFQYHKEKRICVNHFFVCLRKADRAKAEKDFLRLSTIIDLTLFGLAAGIFVTGLCFTVLFDN